MTSSELETFQFALGSRLEELDTLRRQQSITIENTSDPLDNLVRAGERDLAIWRLDKCFAHVRLVNAALARISDGSYGRCLQCDGEIGIKRLTALPHAFNCVRCQEQVEQQGGSFAPTGDGIDVEHVEKEAY